MRLVPYGPLPARLLAIYSPTEAEYQSDLIRLAEKCGWFVRHISDSRREVRRPDGESFWVGDKLAKGLPDLILMKPGRLVFVELKRRLERGANRGLVDPDQKAVMAWLRATGRCEVYLWRPQDLNVALRILGWGKVAA